MVVQTTITGAQENFKNVKSCCILSYEFYQSLPYCHFKTTILRSQDPRLYHWFSGYSWYSCLTLWKRHWDRWNHHCSGFSKQPVHFVVYLKKKLWIFRSEWVLVSSGRWSRSQPPSMLTLARCGLCCHLVSVKLVSNTVVCICANNALQWGEQNEMLEMDMREQLLWALIGVHVWQLTRTHTQLTALTLYFLGALFSTEQTLLVGTFPRGWHWLLLLDSTVLMRTHTQPHIDGSSRPVCASEKEREGLR